jgi:hypothetical protein
MPPKSLKLALAISLLVLAALLTNCGERATHPPAPKYQISIAPSGQIYRLDATSGEVSLIEKPPTIANGRTKLVVGSFYETESGSVLGYLGDGKFQPRPPLSEILK